MRSIILKILFLFYSYYDKGSTKSIAYFSALTAFIMVLYLNVFALLIYFDVLKRNPQQLSPTPMSVKYFIGFLIFIPVFYILSRAFTEEEILNIEMDKRSMRKGYFIIVAYIILSLLMLTFIIRNK